MFSLLWELGVIAITVGSHLVIPDLDTRALGKKSKFDPTSEHPYLAGKVVFVTGGEQFRGSRGSRFSIEVEIDNHTGNAGLGKQTIAYLAAHSPARIYLAARSVSKASSAIADLQRACPSAAIEHVPLDLTSFSSIASAASTFKAREQRLDILVNNAGIMMTPYSLTEEGYEIQFGTNHIGHALLTKLLLPVLLQTAAQPDADVRIINVSSVGERAAPREGIIFEQAALEKQWTWRRYGQSKLANVLFTRELAQRYPQITSVSVHPGVIVTDLYTIFISNKPLKAGLWLFRQIGKVLPGHFRDARGGALTQTWAAIGERGQIENGEFYRPVGLVTRGSGHSRDMALAKRLWEWTDEQLGQHGY